MALEAVNTADYERREPSPKPALSVCPICDGQMEVVYTRNNQQVCVCIDCHSGLTIPSTAWDIVRIKREAKWMPKP
jgi:ssDNA-binding Zn-finger/Zn-ribbon topoisomerase 1